MSQAEWIAAVIGAAGWLCEGIGSNARDDVTRFLAQICDAANLDALAEVVRRDPMLLEASWLRIERVRGLKGPSQQLRRQIRQRIDFLEEQEAQQQRQARAAAEAQRDRRVGTQLPGAPGGDCVVPLGYRLDAGGVRRSRDDGGWDTVITTPLVVTGRKADVDTGEHQIELSWLKDGAWRRQCFERHTLADTRSIVGLSSWGLDINALNARAAMARIASFEQENLPRLPLKQLTAHMGWVDDHTFVWGHKTISSDPDASITFAPPAGDGSEQIADALHQKGSYGEWLGLIKLAMQFPHLTFLLFVGLVPPILKILGAENFVVHLWGETSSGKTTAQMIAASIWGSPSGKNGILFGWDSTRVALERLAGCLQDLPLIIDDTKRARGAQWVTQFVYDLAAGRGRSRGSPDGLRRSSYWCTVCVSSGESEITAHSEDGGAHARVISIQGSPFGASTPQTAALVMRLRDGVQEHYGHAGPLFVQAIVRDPTARQILLNVHQQARLRWQARAQGHPVASRLADYFATIEVAGHFAKQVLDLDVDADAMLAQVWQKVASGLQHADLPRKALEQTFQWAVIHRDTFYPDGQSPGFRGWSGAWTGGDGSPSNQQEWTGIAFIGTILEQVLCDFGHEPRSIITSWAGRGWLQCDPDRHTQRVNVGGQRVRCVCITRQALVSIGAAEEAPVAEGHGEAVTTTNRPQEVE